jgi:hypothetical protein
LVVRSSFSIQGLSSSHLKDSPDVAYALREELAKAAGVDPSLITLTEYCDAGGCVSLTAERRHLAGISITGTALSGLGGERRQSEGSISFEIAAPTASADAVVSAIKDPAVTEKLAQDIETSMEKKGISITASVSTNAATVEDSSSEDNPYKGWIYNINEATGVYHLVDCPEGSLVVNDTVQKQTCAACPANSYSVNPVDDCGSSYCIERPCNTCPAGLVCSGGSSVVSALPTDGSKWDRVVEESSLVEEGSTTRLRVSQCGAGHVLVRGKSPDQDACVPCPTGTFSLEAASFSESRMTSGSAAILVKDFELCATCPTGADCFGGQQATPKPGFWRGKDMACSADSCNEQNGICDPAKCSSIAGSDRRSASGSSAESAPGCIGEDCRVVVMVYRCPPSACAQDANVLTSVNNTKLNHCREGHEGPACGRCASGWAMETGLCVECSGTRNGTSLIVLVVIMGLALITFLYFFSWRPLFGESPPHKKLNSFLERREDLSERFDSMLSLHGMVKQVRRVMPKSLLAYAKVLIGFW